jgi:hypothetical protein
MDSNGKYNSCFSCKCWNIGYADEIDGKSICFHEYKKTWNCDDKENVFYVYKRTKDDWCCGDFEECECATHASIGLSR